MNRTKLNAKANRELKKIFFIEKDIRFCEARLEGCWIHAGSFAHRHKRLWYYDKPDEMLWDFNQVLFLCPSCDQKTEYTKKGRELLEKLFNKLRCGE